MPFNSSQDADRRLVTNATKLTPQEVRDLMVWMHQISAAGMRRLDAELSLQNLEATQRFEQSSRKLTKWLISLTAVLVALTLIIAYFSFLLAHTTHGAK